MVMLPGTMGSDNGSGLVPTAGGPIDRRGEGLSVGRPTQHLDSCPPRANVGLPDPPAGSPTIFLPAPSARRPRGYPSRACARASSSATRCGAVPPMTSKRARAPSTDAALPQSAGGQRVLRQGCGDRVIAGHECLLDGRVRHSVEWQAARPPPRPPGCPRCREPPGTARPSPRACPRRRSRSCSRRPRPRSCAPRPRAGRRSCPS